MLVKINILKYIYSSNELNLIIMLSFYDSFLRSRCLHKKNIDLAEAFVKREKGKRLRIVVEKYAI